MVFPSADATNVFKMHVRYQVRPIWSRNRTKLFKYNKNKYNKLFFLKSAIQFISYREHKQHYVVLQILNDLYLKYVLYCFYDIILLLSAFTIISTFIKLITVNRNYSNLNYYKSLIHTTLLESITTVIYSLEKLSNRIIYTTALAAFTLHVCTAENPSKTVRLLWFYFIPC